MGAIRIVADGELGMAVARRLAGLLGPDGSSPARLAVRGSVVRGSVVRASWRDVPAEFERFAAGTSVPWLGVAFRHPAIRVGPLVVPEVAPCHDCFLARVRQHRSDPLADEVDTAYAADPGLGVTGFPAWAVALAAGQALALLDGMTTGEVRMVDCGTGEVEPWDVVPVHDCETCGRHGPGLDGLRALVRDR